MKTETSALLILLGTVLGVVLLSVVRALVKRMQQSDRRAADAQFRLKSGEVRLGKISETLAPFLEDFPVDVKKPGTSTVFLGQPVDFVHFDPDDGVTFIEVKSGNARLSGSQKKIKELVETGQVRWAEVRVKGEDE